MPGALGNATGNAATGTSVDGGATTGKLELANVTVTGERLQIEGRAIPSHPCTYS